ncbi:MAG: AAA family ATPase [Flavobacteriia bacterium]|nr:AAA family ATPase [Flavobacteriia bacterium]
MLIGICGGSGSGKTTLLRRLSQHYQHLSPSIFIMDNYYKPIQHQFVDQNNQINFDLPSALNEEQLCEDLNQLMKGNSIEVKEYHFNAPPDKHVLLTIEPSPIIFIEGLFSLHYKGVKNLLDYKIFVDVDLETQLDRRLYRDQETRGYTRDSIIYQWENHVLPCYEKYLLPYREQVDFIYRNDTNSEVDFIQLVEKINLLLK